jgi:uncharacterized protein (DUF58 family)
VIYPTRTAILITGLGLPLALACSLLSPGLWILGPAWVVAVLALGLVDAVLGAPLHRVGVRVETAATLAVSTEGTLQARVEFERGRPPALAELALETGARLTPEPARRTAKVAARQAQASFRLKPVRRGEAPLKRLWVRWRGPLGLVWKQTTRELHRTVAIIPNVQAVKDEALRLFSRDAPFGSKAQLERGDGSEFQSLREFQAGMDHRTIDWKRSATHGALVAKEFRTERNHPVVLALDTGRLMCAPLGGVPRIDRAIDAALILAYVALKTGDRVALYAFDAKPRVASGAVSGTGAFPLIQKLAAGIDYSAEETNFTLGLTSLQSRLERRSLVVVFADFADTTSAELMVENMARLLKRHLVLFVIFRDQELEGLAGAEPVEPEDVSRAVVAGALLRERELVVAKLRRLGVHVLETPVERLGPALLDAYVDLKRRDLL